MALGLSLSGISNIGHDIGGFAGPAPDAELLVRWVAHGAFLPRFSIHSWNDDRSANEPWMHPQVTAQIAALIKLRYRFIPYFYHLLWQWRSSYEPVLRPTFAEFPCDPRCFQESDDMMIGDALLLASVVEPGQRERSVYLPEGARWLSYWSGQLYQGGSTVVLPAPWDQPVLLIREGSVVPLNVAEQHFARPADRRAFIVVAPQGECELEGSCIEDDGVSEDWRNGAWGSWQLGASGDADVLRLRLSAQGRMPVRAGEIDLLLPAYEKRRVDIDGAQLLADVRVNGWRQLTVAPR